MNFLPLVNCPFCFMIRPLLHVCNMLAWLLFLPGRLHLVFSSPRHLMVSTGCIIVLEILYKMDFSLLGFLVCSVILGFGEFWDLICCIHDWILNYSCYASCKTFSAPCPKCLISVKQKGNFILVLSVQWPMVSLLGIFEATSLERSKKSPLEAHELSNGVFHNQLPISALPS